MSSELTEREFQTSVLELAHRLGWASYHTYDSRRSAPGFPDLVLVHPDHGVIFRELKARGGKTSAAQSQWIWRLQEAGADADVWSCRADWPRRIEGELRGETYR